MVFIFFTLSTPVPFWLHKYLCIAYSQFLKIPALPQSVKPFTSCTWKAWGYVASCLNPCFAGPFHERPAKGGFSAPFYDWQPDHHQLASWVITSPTPSVEQPESVSPSYPDNPPHDSPSKKPFPSWLEERETHFIFLKAHHSLPFFFWFSPFPPFFGKSLSVPLESSKGLILLFIHLHDH